MQAAFLHNVLPILIHWLNSFLPNDISPLLVILRVIVPSRSLSCAPMSAHVAACVLRMSGLRLSSCRPAHRDKWLVMSKPLLRAGLVQTNKSPCGARPTEARGEYFQNLPHLICRAAHFVPLVCVGVQILIAAPNRGTQAGDWERAPRASLGREISFPLNPLWPLSNKQNFQKNRE